jgi:iron uptake system component EfeO
VHTLTRALPVLAIALLAGCSADPAASADAVTIESSADACTVSETDLPSGSTTFSITNTGDDVTEVYVYDGDRVVTEKEDIGPGTSADMTVDLEAGDYEVACKPGMVGDGIRTPITVAS